MSIPMFSEQRDVRFHFVSSIAENRFHRRRASHHCLSLPGTNLGSDDVTAYDVTAEVDSAECFVESASDSEPFDSGFEQRQTKSRSESFKSSSESFKSSSGRSQIERPRKSSDSRSWRNSLMVRLWSVEKEWTGKLFYYKVIKVFEVWLKIQ